MSLSFFFKRQQDVASGKTVDPIKTTKSTVKRSAPSTTATSSSSSSTEAKKSSPVKKKAKLIARDADESDSDDELMLDAPESHSKSAPVQSPTPSESSSVPGSTTTNVATPKDRNVAAPDEDSKEEHNNDEQDKGKHYKDQHDKDKHN